LNRRIKLVLALSFIFFKILYSYAQLTAESTMGLPTAVTLAEMNAITTAPEGAIVYNIEGQQVYMFNGTIWVPTSNNNWLITGNTGLAPTSFLGHIDDVAMEIRSNNLPILQFGRRETLGLTQGFPDYTDDDQPLVHVNGNGSISALQFAASGASFYRPMFFSTPNGSFRLKGSSGGTDLFEIGSAGPANDGRLEFVIGDDGQEPIVFKRYDFRRGQFTRELFRVQGSNNTADATTRFGINLNPQEVPVDDDYDDPNTTFTIANSTLQVAGSVATSVLSTNGNITLTEEHHTILITGTHNITLPLANTCEGRLYIIKNSTNTGRTISTYLDISNTNQTIVPGNSILYIKSDGTNWQQLNNSASSQDVQGLQYYVWNTANVSQPNIDNKRTLGVSTTQGQQLGLLNNATRGSLAPDANGYIIHFKGVLNVQNTGNFTFNARSDDGSRVYVDDVLVVENWFNQGPTTRSGTVTLAEGEHDIEFWYYEDTGGDFMEFSWGANPDGYPVGSTIDAPQFLVK